MLSVTQLAQSFSSEPPSRLTAGRHSTSGHGLTPAHLWSGLLDGQWSIVDRLDQQGRRFLVAQKNFDTSVSQGALTSRERQVIARAATGKSVKEIAFEFSIASSTVTQILRVAFLKMGISCRTELVRIHTAIHRCKLSDLDHDC
jgi:DNA-binding CsgD family transcriptional regulator